MNFFLRNFSLVILFLEDWSLLLWLMGKITKLNEDKSELKTKRVTLFLCLLYIQ